MVPTHKIENILVTGGAGFIGSNFIRSILLREPQVRIVNLDALTYAGHPANLDDLSDPRRHTFFQGNITDRPLVDALLRKHSIDTIVHFAAETHVDRSIHYPQIFVETNVVGTFALLEAARQYWAASSQPAGQDVRFHHVSSDEVFGTLGPQDPPFNETTPYDPRSPYSASKAASDHLVRAYFYTYGLPVTITNCSNNYGPRQFPEKLIPVMLGRALEGKTLPVYGDGRQVRDWLYVDDHSEAIHRVLTAGRPGETYNIGGENQPTNLEVVETLCQILDELVPDSAGVPHERLIEFVPDRPGHDRRYDIDIRKIKRELGWQPAVPLAEGLLITARWYLDHPAWMETVRGTPEYRAWIDRNYTARNLEVE